MSESYGGGPSTGSARAASSGTVETAASEAGEVAGTAAEGASQVLGTAKAEAGAVVHEAKTQVQDLVTQSTRELKEQAGIQQQRVADGLRAVGDELHTMAESSENPGVAADLVTQVSARVTQAATWLGDRDPGSLLNEVKAYARRKPGTFIAAAAVAGLVAGRLTRALAESARDSSPADSGGTAGAASGSSSGSASAAGAPPEPITSAVTPSATEGGVDATAAPVFEQTRAAWNDARPSEGGADVRSDTV